jgi:hypothetical protein
VTSFSAMSIEPSSSGAMITSTELSLSQPQPLSQPLIEERTNPTLDELFNSPVPDYDMPSTDPVFDVFGFSSQWTEVEPAPIALPEPTISLCQSPDCETVEEQTVYSNGVGGYFCQLHFSQSTYMNNH